MEPALFIFGFVIDVFGKIMLGATVLLVHGIVLKERKIDMKVIKELKIEKTLGFIGILLILIGSGIQVFFMFQ